MIHVFSISSPHARAYNLRWLLLLLLLVGWAVPALRAQIRLNGVSPFRDVQTGLMLLPVRASQYDAPFSALVSFDADSAWTDFCLDGQTFRSGDSLRIDRPDGQTDYPFTALRADGSVVSGYLAFTSLPVVQLRGTFGYDYAAGNVTFQEAGMESAAPMAARLKWRGGITNGAFRHKRNYKIKFVKADGTKKNRSFFGLRSDNDWILDAGQVDLARCRNRVATDLWLDLCTQPYYASEAPKALSGSRGDFVEVFLNDRYEGIYSLMECIDRKQMQLADYADDTFHGMLWKTSQWTLATGFGGDLPFDNAVADCNGVEVKYPDPDDVLPTDYSVLSRAIHFMSAATPEAIADSLDLYFDLPVLVDYFVFLNVIMGVDNLTKNIYWACYDQTLSPRLTLAVWDLDNTFGQLYGTDGYKTQGLSPETAFINTWSPGSLLGRCDDHPWFVTLALNRYRALRPGVLSTDSLQARFTRVFDRFLVSGAARREEQRWSGDSDIHGRVLDFRAEHTALLSWIRDRMNHLDSDFTPSGIDSPRPDKSVRGATGIWTLDGHLLPTTDVQSLPRGLYIVDGQKVWIKK